MYVFMVQWVNWHYNGTLEIDSVHLGEAEARRAAYTLCKQENEDVVLSRSVIGELMYPKVILELEAKDIGDRIC